MLSAFRNCSVETKYSDDPAGGVPAWSRAFAGMTVKSDVSPAKSTTCAARRAGVHLLLVERPDVEAEVRPAGRVAEHVGRHVDAVRPDAELRVVAEAAGGGDRVEVPAAGDRVARLRDGEALEDASGGLTLPRAVELEREVGDEPAVLEAVVEDDRVAEVVGVAEVPEVPLAHERVERERRDAVAVRLVVDADRGVDRLDVVGRADVAVRVGRVAGAQFAKSRPAKFESGARRRGCDGARIEHRPAESLPDWWPLRAQRPRPAPDARAAPSSRPCSSTFGRRTLRRAPSAVDAPLASNDTTGFFNSLFTALTAVGFEVATGAPCAARPRPSARNTATGEFGDSNAVDAAGVNAATATMPTASATLRTQQPAQRVARTPCPQVPAPAPRVHENPSPSECA